MLQASLEHQWCVQPETLTKLPILGGERGHFTMIRKRNRKITSEPIQSLRMDFGLKSWSLSSAKKKNCPWTCLSIALYHTDSFAFSKDLKSTGERTSGTTPTCQDPLKTLKTGSLFTVSLQVPWILKKDWFLPVHLNCAHGLHSVTFYTLANKISETFLDYQY